MIKTVSKNRTTTDSEPKNNKLHLDPTQNTSETQRRIREENTKEEEHEV